MSGLWVGVVLEWPAMGNMPVSVRVLCLVQTHQVMRYLLLYTLNTCVENLALHYIRLLCVDLIPIYCNCLSIHRTGFLINLGKLLNGLEQTKVSTKILTGMVERLFV